MANLKFRRFVLGKAKGNKEVQQALLYACQQDILFWINGFVWQYNPNAIGTASVEVGPFITWGFQDEAILGAPGRPGIIPAIEKRYDLLIEKSREMGASWLCLLVILWHILFHPWKKFLLISRNELAVDKPDDPDALMWKLDFVVEHLPGWMTAGRVRRRKLVVKNPLLNSAVTGASSTGESGVGGRGTGMFIDEFSRIKEDFALLQGTHDHTRCRIFNGTHLGLGTAFYELSQRVDMHKLILHWSQHPDKRRGLYKFDHSANRLKILDTSYDFPPDYQFVTDGTPTGGPYPGVRSPWYDAECRRRSNRRAVAMDLDIDPTGSVSQVFDPLQIQILRSTYCVPPVWEGELIYDRDKARPIAMHKRAGGKLRLWCNLGYDGKPPLAYCGAGSDLSSGTGTTASTWSCWNAERGEKWAEYADANMRPDEFAALCVSLCWLFKNPEGVGALFAWEFQGPGTVFGNRVVALGYLNVYFRSKEFEIDKRVSDTPGWVPSNDNKRVLLQDYEASLVSRAYINRSDAALAECLAFKYDGRGQVINAKEENVEGDPSGARVNHADMAIADALAVKMCKDLARPRPAEQKPGPKVLSLAWRRARADNERREAMLHNA